MKQGFYKRVCLLTIVLSMLSFTNGCFCRRRPVAHVLVGAAAKLVASAYFLGNRTGDYTLEKALKEEMLFGRLLHPYIKVRFTPDGKGVVAKGWNVERTAVFRPGFGVTLLPEKPGFLLEPPALDIPEPPPVAPLPTRVLPEPYRSRMQDFLDWAFEKVPPGDCRRTRAVVIVQGGRVIAERYARHYDMNSRLISWSMAKSVVNALVGILVRQGRIDLHAPARVAEWHGTHSDPRGEITVNQLLHMNSGIYYPDWIQQSSTKMLFRTADMAHFYASLGLGYEPGTHHYYANGAAVLLARVVQQAVPADERYLFPYRELFHKIGMNSARFEVDPEGTFVGSSYVYATPREWARFGLLFLHNGVWKGERILPSWWVAYTRESAPHSKHGEYGAFFWTNDHRAWKNLPEDTFEATGFEGQLVAIIPSLDLVAVRMGHSLAHGWDHEEFLEHLLRVLPPATPRHGNKPAPLFSVRARKILDQIRKRR